MCCSMSGVTSETETLLVRKEYNFRNCNPIYEEKAWLTSSAIYNGKPSVLQCFSGCWSLSGIYLQQVRDKINKLLVRALQVAPQRWFVWDQILQLTRLLIFNRKWSRKSKYYRLYEIVQGTQLNFYVKHLHCNNSKLLPFWISAGLNCWVLLHLKTMSRDGVLLTGILIHIDRRPESKYKATCLIGCYTSNLHLHIRFLGLK